jgi:hypothetical protein
MLDNSIDPFSRTPHFCPHPGGGLGGSGGWGKATEQGESPFTAKMRPFIRRLLASQTSQHFLLKIKDVAF